MNDTERDPAAVLRESVAYLALIATRRLYAEQESLWRLGEHGRQCTLEDFGHHFRALGALDPDSFDAHVTYCAGLFAARRFPQQWLTDAWRVMDAVCAEELPRAAATQVSRILSKYLPPTG